MRRAASPATAAASGGGAPTKRIEAAGVDQFARQLMADNVLGHAADLDQRVEINPGVDPHLLAQQNEFLGANVAGRLRLPGKGAPAQPADRRIKLSDAHLQ